MTSYDSELVMDSQQPEPDPWTSSRAALKPLLPPMIRLPDELLLCIAARLTENSDLRRLSLVNTKMKSIAQEALMRELSMPQNAIVDLLDTLCRRPDLARKIRSVDLGDYQVRTPEMVDDARMRISRLDKETLFHRLRAALDDINEDGLFSSIASGMLKGYGTIWRPRHQYYLGILAALTPNISELTVQLPTRKEAEAIVVNFEGVLEPFKLMDPFQGPGLDLLAQRLRVLNLPCVTYHRLQTYNITLQSLVCLRRLVVPLDALIYPNFKATDPVKVLPPNLEVLHIRPCGKNFLYWFTSFFSAFFKGHFLKLKKLELSLDTCLRSTLLLITQARPPLSSLRNVVYMLECSGLTISMLKKDGTSAGSLLDEFDAWLCLSDLEAWCAATRDLQFSAAVERTESGKPRKRTRSEARHFIRGTLEPPSKPRRICRFDPQVSAKGAKGEGTCPNVTFGKDNKKTKFKRDKCAFDSEKWAEVLSHYGLCDETMQDAPEPSTPVVVLDDVQSNGLDRLQEQLLRLTITNTTSFSISSSIPLSPAVSGFDASKWLELEFFPGPIVNALSKATPSAPKKKEKQTAPPSTVRRRSRTPPARRMKQKVA